MAHKKEVDDRFKRFGTVSFTAISKTNDFVTHLEDGKVMGTRCTRCGRSFFPPRADCFECLDSPVDWFEVTGNGTLLTYSRLQFAPIGFEADVPYCIALLDYGDYKVFGRIAPDVDEAALSVGMPMKTRVHELPNGQVNYVFEPV